MKFYSQITYGLILLLISSTGAPLLAHAETAELPPRLAAREKLFHYLFWNSEKDVRKVRSLLEEYRWSKGEKAVLSVRQGPFPQVLLGLLLKDPSVYGELYSSQYNELTTQPKYEDLYDAFLGLRISGQLPEAIRDEASALTLSMAKKALRAKSDSCTLDESDRFHKVSKLKLAKIWLGWSGGCETRKAIFNVVKRNLHEVKKNLKDLNAHRTAQGTDPCLPTAAPELAQKFALGCGVIAEVNKDFGRLFRDGLSSMLDDLSRKFPALVVKKFKGSDHAIWSDVGSIIDPVEDLAIENGRQIVNLKSFARGMRVDLQAAKVLMNSKLSSDRALAGGLFYAVVNRLILALGADRVKLDEEGHLVTIDTTVYAANAEGEDVAVMEPAALDEKGLLKPVFEVSVGKDGKPVEVLKIRPLQFGLEPVGGFGVNRVGETLSLSPWDPVAYDPDAVDPSLRTPYRLIPNRVSLDSNGRAELIQPVLDLVQKNTDLAELGIALAEFITETKPAGAFGKFFGSQDQALEIRNKAVPMLIPDVGRLLPVAILGVVAQNALHPELGHVKQVQTGALLAFQDEASFNSITSENVSAEGVAAIMSAVHDLREALRNDVIFKKVPSLATLETEVKSLEAVLQLGALILGAQTQDPESGKFFDTLYAKGERTSSFDTQINTLIAFLKAYNRAHTVPMTRVRIKEGLENLVSELAGTSGKELTRDQLFRLCMLWDLIQVHLPADWPDLPWKEWNSVFYELRKDLERGL